MRALGIIMGIIAMLGCVSMTERIVNEGMKGLVWDANYIPANGGDGTALAALYEHLTTALRIDIQYVPASDETLRGAFGISYVAGDQWFIRVRQDVSVNGTIEILAHEAAHLLQPPHLSRSQGDVFAEIVSAHVADRLGVPGAAATSALWLRQHKAALSTALDLQNEIAHVANVLTPGSGAKLVAR